MVLGLDTKAALVHNYCMATKQQTITVRLTAKRKKEIEALAKHERRTISNFADYLLLMGIAKYYELDVEKTLAKRP